MARASARFLAPYYVFNAALLLGLPIVRHLWLHNQEWRAHSKLTSSQDLAQKEQLTIIPLALGLLLKWYKRSSLDEFVADAFSYTKLAVGMLLFYLDYRIFAYYLLGQLLVWLLCEQPMYSGPSNLEDLTPAELQERVLGDSSKERCWLVQLWAPWAPACAGLAPVVAELSLTYSSNHLSFARVNVGQWPSVAEQLGVQLRGEQSAELPAFLLFRAGRELVRLPSKEAEGGQGRKMYRQQLVETFELGQVSSGGQATLLAGGSKPKGRESKPKKR